MAAQAPFCTKPSGSSGQTPSVRAIMHTRALGRSKRKNRTDGFHLALVIECGGMRGAAAGGFLKSLADLHLVDSIDSFHGSSSGACAAAYLFSNQFESGCQIYERISRREIVNPLGFLSQPCLVDTDYIVDEVIRRVLPLDTQPILDNPGVLNVITTSVSECAPAIHNSFANGDSLLRALKATLRVPGPFERGIAIGNDRHVDGGILAPVPVFSAIAAGATHILIISTQRVQDYKLSRVRTQIESVLLKFLYGQRMKLAYTEAQSVNRPPAWNCAEAEHREIDVLVRPASATHCSWSTIDKATLKQIEKESAEIALSYFSFANSRIISQ